MLPPSRKLLYAVEAVLDIAFNAGPTPVQSGEITRRQKIPKRYLEQVLQQLVRADILTGVRGPRGGYRLARERRRISLGDIVRVIAAMEQTADPLQEPGGAPLGRDVVRPIWRELQDEFQQKLDAITLQDLCGRARLAGIRGEGAKQLDYSI